MDRSIHYLNAEMFAKSKPCLSTTLDSLFASRYILIAIPLLRAVFSDYNVISQTKLSEHLAFQHALLFFVIDFYQREER
ncbi:MAG: hypothetical protein HY562_03540 [Ignavibacteriales bacterium]|nr:hypothetical protein [Ignavibacteriales bacterium]